MGRPKGSKNKGKKDQTHVTTEPKACPPAETAQEGSDAGGEGGAGPASDGEPESSPPAELEEHKAEPPAAPPTLEEIPAMTATLCRLIHDREERREEAKAAAKRAREDIEAYDTEISRLAERIEAADLREDIDHAAGIVTYTSRTTGQIVRTRPLVLSDKQQELPFDEKPAGPPEKSFQSLKEGKVWQHDQYGFVRILAVFDDSVRVRTEDLSEAPEGIEIGRADWDAHNAYPREVPNPLAGEVWEWEDGREGLIVGIRGDIAATVDFINDEGSKEIELSLLSFVGAHKKNTAAPEAAE